MAMVRLLRYALPHVRLLVTVLMAMAFNIVLELLRPWPLKLLLDNVLGHEALPAGLQHVLDALPGPGGVQGLLLWVALSTVGIFLIGTLTSMVHAIASVSLGQRVTYALGADLFLHMQRLSLLFHSRRPVGDSIVRVTEDSYCVESLLTGAVLPLLESGVTLVAMFAIMWQLQPTLTLLSLSVVPFLVLTIRMLGGPMQSRSREKRDLEGQMASVVERALSAIPAVQAFTREEQEHRQFRRYADATVTAYLRMTAAQMWFKFFAELVTAVGTAALIYLGAQLALQGKITVGTVWVFLSYLASLYHPLDSATETATVVQYAAAQASRVNEILETPPDVRDAPHARELALRGHIQYEHVTFGYEASRPVLKDISLEVVPGEVVAIVGPTGAGKTTLVSLLIRFFDPWSGHVAVDGVELSQLRLRSLRQQVAIVLQDPFIFPLTVAENIAYGRPDASRAEIVAAAAAANADAFIRRLPEGYEEEIGEHGSTLSGGEKQRLSIARAFLKNAPVLVLDEPTSALDARTEALLLDALDRLMKGRTTFIIAHRLSTIRRADRILVLDQGALIEQGTHADLMARDGLYATLYRQQMDRRRPAVDVLVARPGAEA